MTQWVSDPTGGRDRGPVALARAWTEVLARPRRFFETAVAPGDQAPGLVFAGTVVLVAGLTRLATVPNAYPVVNGQPLASALLVVALLVLLATPAALHLTAAAQTLLLLPFVEDRAGVSETVQVVAYATAPCILAGVPEPAVVALCCGYGTALFVVGLATVHEIAVPKALLLGALPAAAVFGYGFGGYAAAETVVESLLASSDLAVDLNVTVGV